MERLYLQFSCLWHCCLQEQHDQLQRQFQQAIAREADVRSSLETYKTEHMQLLAANAQLVGKCQELNKKVQVRFRSSYCAHVHINAIERLWLLLLSVVNYLQYQSAHAMIGACRQPQHLSAHKSDTSL